MGATTMNKQQQNHGLRNRRQPKPLGALINFAGQIFTLDSAVVKTQN